MTSFVARAQSPDARKFLLHIVLRPRDFGFVRTLFHPHGFACQASQTSTLRVVMTLTAATDRVASRLPKSRLTTVSIRHDGSFVRARDLYFSLAPNRAIPPQKTIRLSSLAAAQPWITLSRPEALNTSGPTRACQSALGHDERRPSLCGHAGFGKAAGSMISCALALPSIACNEDRLDVPARPCTSDR